LCPSIRTIKTDKLLRNFGRETAWELGKGGSNVIAQAMNLKDRRTLRGGGVRWFCVVRGGSMCSNSIHSFASDEPEGAVA